jgi:hypothetical protein
VKYAADRAGAFDPYIRIPGGPQGPNHEEDRSNTIRALLMDRAVQQVRQILAAVARADLDDLPPVLRGLHRETRGGLTRTATAMLAALERFLTRKKHADVRERLDPAFRPMGAWVRGSYAVTSPALLVVQSILYSHCEWFQDCLWEIHSAVRAYNELRQSGYPEDHCRFVAGILAHQTLVRTAWTLDTKPYHSKPSGQTSRKDTKDPTETFAFFFENGNATSADKSVRCQGTADKIAEAAAQAIARTLFEFLPNFVNRPSQADGSPHRRRLAAALILHSLCLQARHHQTEQRDQIAQIKSQALRFFDYLIERPDDHTGSLPGLVYIHYGRYLHRANDGLWKEIRQYAVDELTRSHTEVASGEPPKHLTLCLPRVGSLRVWNNRLFDSKATGLNNCAPGKDHFATAEEDRLPHASETPIKSTIEQVAGKVLCYRFSGDDRDSDPAKLADIVRCNLGLPSDSKFDVRKLADEIANLKREQEKERIKLTPEDLELKLKIADLFDLVRKEHLAYVDLIGWKESSQQGDNPTHSNADSTHNKRPDYFPSPLVGHILHAYRDFSPRDFIALHITGQEPRTVAAKAAGDVQFTVWLPHYVPKIGDVAALDSSLSEIWGEEYDRQPDALIARYAAAMMIGILVSFAPRRLVLDYLCDDDRAREWKKLIAAAFKQNGGPLMRLYTEQVRARRAECDTAGNTVPRAPLPRDIGCGWEFWAPDIGIGNDAKASKDPELFPETLRILGIDAGGTSIKYDLFEVNWAYDSRSSIGGNLSSPKSLAESGDNPDPIFWSDLENSDSETDVANTVKALFRHVRDRIKNPPDGEDSSVPADPSGSETDSKGFHAVGIAYPGPIADGVPVGVSGVLRGDKLNYETLIAKGNPHKLHQLDFAQSAKDVPLLETAVVTVLNDGEADILASESNSRAGEEGIHLVLKEGTGVAYAVFEDGVLMERTAETAKAILNLHAGPPPRKDNPFQQGALSGFVSKNKLESLLPEACKSLQFVLEWQELADRESLEKTIRLQLAKTTQDLGIAQNENELAKRATLITEVILRYCGPLKDGHVPQWPAIKDALVKCLQPFAGSQDQEQTLASSLWKHLEAQTSPADVALSRAKDILNEALGLALESALTKSQKADVDIQVFLRNALKSHERTYVGVGDIATSMSSAAKGLLAECGPQLVVCHNKARIAYVMRVAKEDNKESASFLAGFLHSKQEPTTILDRKEDKPEFPWLRKQVDSVNSHLRVPRSWDDLDLGERTAIALAWVLGRWLADAIALSWDLYQMRKVQLAGGPLKEYTGVYIVQSARMALEQVYGFDLDSSGGSADWYARSRRREIRALGLVDPPFDSSEGGPLGAAMAALDGFVMDLKRQQLRACRKHVSAFTGDKPTRRTFTVAELKAEAAKELNKRPWVVSEDEIAYMLETESAALALTREQDGSFRPLPEFQLSSREEKTNAPAVG